VPVAGHRNDHGFVMVQVVRAQDHNPPSGAPDTRSFPQLPRRLYRRRG
jgi:hypothetical protein